MALSTSTQAADCLYSSSSCTSLTHCVCCQTPRPKSTSRRRRPSGLPFPAPMPHPGLSALFTVPHSAPTTSTATAAPAAHGVKGHARGRPAVLSLRDATRNWSSARASVASAGAVADVLGAARRRAHSGQAQTSQQQRTSTTRPPRRGSLGAVTIAAEEVRYPDSGHSASTGTAAGGAGGGAGAGASEPPASAPQHQTGPGATALFPAFGHRTRSRVGYNVFGCLLVSPDDMHREVFRPLLHRLRHKESSAAPPRLPPPCFTVEATDPTVGQAATCVLDYLRSLQVYMIPPAPAT